MTPPRSRAVPRRDPTPAEEFSGFHHDVWRQRHHVYYEEQTRLLRKLVGPGASVVELGCGTGETLAALQPAHGLGVDLSDAMVQGARRRHPGLQFMTADAQRPLPVDRTFDVVLMADLVGELDDLWAAFRAMRSLVHPHSRIIITHFNYLWEPLLTAAQALHLKRPQKVQNWFSLADMRNLLELNGFETVTSGDRALLPLPVPVVKDVANRVLGALPVVHHLNLIQYLVARPGPAFHVEPEPLSVSVIIPAKNEKGNIRPAIRRTPAMGTRTEVIFVEGGSRDGTREEILAAISEEKSPNALRFIPQVGKGKADAVRTGFEAATGDILMILDADLTVIPEDLPRFHLAIAERRGEFINGSRLVYQMEEDAMRTLNLVANKFFGMAFTHVLSQPVKDTLCGTKVLRRADYLRVRAHQDRFGAPDPFGDFDLLFGAAALGLRIVDIPVRYKSRVYGSTQIDRFRHGLMLFRMLGVGVKQFKLR